MENFIIAIVSPILVWVATLAATWIKKSMPDFLVSGVIVPAFTALLTIVSAWVIPNAPWYAVAIPGLAAVFIKQFLKDLAGMLEAIVLGKNVPRMGINPLETDVATLRKALDITKSEIASFKVRGKERNDPLI
jgi:hypothetical protein